MSLENFPDSEIPFNDLFDGRLDRFGITTDIGDQRGALIAPDGSIAIVKQTDRSYAEFPHNMPVLVRNAIATEFCIDLSPCGESTCVVIAAPSCGDVKFIRDWLNAAFECDCLLDDHLRKHPEFRESISRLEVEYCIEFAPAAAAFVRKWLKRGRSFSVNLRNSRWAEIFTIMVGIGFFARAGARHQMIVPEVPAVDLIIESLLRFAETEDAAYFLHPERHLVTMTSYQAHQLRQL